MNTSTRFMQQEEVNTIPCLSVAEVLAKHDEAKSMPITHESRREVRDLFDQTKYRIALMTIQERVEFGNRADEIVRQRKNMLTFIEFYWREINVN